MATSGGILQAAPVAHGPRWRALTLAAVLVGTLWSTGFATGRLTAPDASENRGSVITSLDGAGPIDRGDCVVKEGC
jgi:hypothetical protein